ncbi:MAG: hypothetical protein SFV21_04425 [Rhodospirillaceae bacterium]|nr:hypothetical protein [Rhodospirillaceae bacterium]
MRSRYLLALAPLATLSSCGAASAEGPTFTAKAGPGTLAIFSSSQKAVLCTAEVVFSYMENGKREFGRHSCQNYNIAVGTDLEVCRVDDALLVEPIIEGPVTSQCQ